MWLKEYDRYVCKIQNLAYGEIDERSFINPHTRPSAEIVPTAFLARFPSSQGPFDLIMITTWICYNIHSVIWDVTII